MNKELHAEAKALAAELGYSMSQVATAGLEAYVESIPKRTASTYRKTADEAIELEPLQQTLPIETQEELRRMKVERDKAMNLYITALFDAGWTLQAISDPLGVSRQAMYIRIKKERARWEARDLAAKEAGKRKPARPRIPDVPEPPYFASGPGRDEAEKIDWAVWVPRDVYTVVAKHARRSGEPMHEVMEEILRAFLDRQILSDED